ncbi:MAG: gfo/Idh/MocA family oxidoreductase, partial [Planctomycetota bacterium]
FVLPYQGGQANFVTALPEFQVEGCDFEMIPNATVSTVSESANSSADSQETNLFRTFNELVISGQPDSRWPEISLKTQRVMDAIEESGKQGGVEVML